MCAWVQKPLRSVSQHLSLPLSSAWPCRHRSVKASPAPHRYWECQSSLVPSSKATMATEKKPGRRESKVFEKCSADQKCVAPSAALTMVKGVGLRQGVSEGQRWENIWDWGKKGKWGYGALVAVASEGKGTKHVFFFFNQFFRPQRVGITKLGTNLRLIYLVWWSRKSYHSPSMHFDEDTKRNTRVTEIIRIHGQEGPSSFTW